MSETRIPITEELLKSMGFKWHQFDRQPSKHWLLWLGNAIDDRVTTYEDLGLELGFSDWPHDPFWFCWIRSDTAGRYSRFLHIRHLHFQDELIRLIEAITGFAWKPENCFFGSYHCERFAAQIRKDYERLDRELLRNGRPWREIEKDDTRGRALPEHMEKAVTGKDK